MRLLVIGKGVIGITYAYVLKKTGVEIFHLLRKEERDSCHKKIAINLLDGRTNPSGKTIEDWYDLTLADKNTYYDFILVSVQEEGIRDIVKELKDENITGTIILMCDLFESRESLKEKLQDYPYIISYMCAGGQIKDSALSSCLYDHIILEKKEKAQGADYDAIVRLFDRANIKIETPYDAWEWIVVHTALNACLITTAFALHPNKNSQEAISALIADEEELRNLIRAIRECVLITSFMDIKTAHFNSHLFPFRTPSVFAAHFAQKQLEGNLFQRDLLTLQKDIPHLRSVAGKLYALGKDHGVKAPYFYPYYLAMRERFKSQK